ncbi:MAG: enoyl-CoA hydratase/isomerase family protein [Bacteriovoracaceae bacterium]|nr:enoyl-CoA hydratase/isomerase family protein [Bacteriovoracaceae bacterium]
MNYQKFSYEIVADIVYIGFGVNETKSLTTLGKDTLEELERAIKEVGVLDKGRKIKGLVFFSHKPGCFLAGVDVNLISDLRSETDAKKGCERGQSIYSKIEDLKVPTMALIDGICLGGGLELALSCKKIAVSDSPKTALGLPEVMLGVLPGFGGTYRLPRKIGLPNAIDMILTGKQIRAAKAYKMGLADFIMPSERLLELADKYLKIKPTDRNKDLMQKITANFVGRKVIFQKARETVLSTTKGFYPAPLRILELMDSGANRNREAYMDMEGQAFAELSQTPQSKNLQHIFFMTDRSKKTDSFEEGLKKVTKGAVLGAGTMGGGIAWLFAEYNQSPIMKDINLSGLELGLKQASSVFRKDVEKKKMTEDEFERKIRSIEPTHSYSGFNGVDLLIEAVVENMEVKKKVFAEVEQHVRPDCLLTSNTSSLSVTEMSKALKNPERFAGLHFFNPVNKMPLVEIIKHPEVSKETIQALYKWVLSVKKTPVVVNDGPGFLVNRILMPFINESAYLLEEGVSIEALDQAVLNFGMPMGTCRLMDEVGIDVLVKVGKIMEDGLGARAKASKLSARLTDAGLLGRKTSKGFYLYGDNGRSTGVNPHARELISTKSVKMDETTIQMRVFLPMINEAANILMDKIVDNAEAVDLGLIYGIGFPPFRGGLLKYADSEGLDRICEAIREFEEKVSKDRYALSPYLKNLADTHKTFYSA